MNRSWQALAAALALSGTVPALAEPAMWRVHNATTEIILFGTLHELPPGIVWLTPRITTRVDAADALVLEAVIPDDPSVVNGLVSKLGYSPGEKPLDTRIAPSKRSKLDAAVAATTTSMDSLDLMETWLAAIVIGDATLGKLGLTAANGAEAVLSTRVRAAGKPVTPLETLQQQFGYFDTLPEPDQRALLDATVDDIATAKADTDKLVAAWLAGDTETIAASFKGDALGATPVVAKALMTDRNARWADWIKARLRTPGKLFVAVGAAHLTGPNSVQAMLKARGIAVERLP